MIFFFKKYGITGAHVHDKNKTIHFEVFLENTQKPVTGYLICGRQYRKDKNHRAVNTFDPYNKQRAETK
jgi:hypothetical protein